MNPYNLISQAQIADLAAFAANCRYACRGIAIVNQDESDDWFEQINKLPALEAHDPFEDMEVCFVQGDFVIPEVVTDESAVAVDSSGVAQIEEALQNSPYADMDELAAAGMALIRGL